MNDVGLVSRAAQGQVFQQVMPARRVSPHSEESTMTLSAILLLLLHLFESMGRDEDNPQAGNQAPTTVVQIDGDNNDVTVDPQTQGPVIIQVHGNNNHIHVGPSKTQDKFHYLLLQVVGKEPEAQKPVEPEELRTIAPAKRTDEYPVYKAAQTEEQPLFKAHIGGSVDIGGAKIGGNFDFQID